MECYDVTFALVCVVFIFALANTSSQSSTKWQLHETGYVRVTNIILIVLHNVA